MKKMIRIMLDVVLVLYGLAYFHLNRKKPLNERTPAKSHLALIRLFCASSGFSNDLLSTCISFFDKPLMLPSSKGILGDLSTKEVHEITKTLERDGFALFENKLSPDLIQKLYHFAATQECVPRSIDAAIDKPISRTIYDKNNLKSSVYDIPLQASLSNKDIQALLRDHSILTVAQAYLRTSPKLDAIAFWWSTPFSSTPQANSAQMFHFDMDRIKWLKFFLFLTEVTLENGPHVFIKHSHRRGKIPKELLKAGYARLHDKEVFKYFSDEVKTFTVPTGTILAEDTRGLHKGTPLLSGERLVLELQFSNSLFGAFTPPATGAQIQDAQLLDFARKNKKIFQLYPL